MLPNLVPGDRIITNKLAYGLTIPFVQTPLFQWAFPKRGEVILFSFSNNSDIYIKRVIGLPGDLVTFGESLKYNYDINMSKEPSRTFFESRRFLVPPGKIFVLGDNRDNSADSRVYGYVDAKDVYGRASFVLFSTTGDSLFPKFRGDRTLSSIVE